MLIASRTRFSSDLPDGWVIKMVSGEIFYTNNKLIARMTRFLSDFSKMDRLKWCIKNFFAILMKERGFRWVLEEV